MTSTTSVLSQPAAPASLAPTEPLQHSATAAGSVHAFDEPDAVAARGTVIVLTGRGESAAGYQRFGRRISADAYRVRVVEVDLDDIAAVRAQVTALVQDRATVVPVVLTGSDTGATLAAQFADEFVRAGSAEVAGVVLAGVAVPQGEQSAGAASEAAEGPDWEEELEARSACPAYRRVITEDGNFYRGAFAHPVPADLELRPSGLPTLILHGSADEITASADAFEPFRDDPQSRLRLVVGGRHDVLNDVSHRSVAATIVTFLESLKLGPQVPVIVAAIQN